MIFPWTWIGVAGGVVLLAGVIAVQEIRLANARTNIASAKGERDVAQQMLATEKTEHEKTTQALDVARISVQDATAAAEMIRRFARENDTANKNALAACTAANERSLVTLRECRTAASVAKRWGALRK